MVSSKRRLFTQGFSPQETEGVRPSDLVQKVRPLSSVVERSRHMRDVVGSTPTAATTVARPIPDIPLYERQRFHAKVNRMAGPDACWPWVGAASSLGYGRFKIEGRLYSSHRIAYTLAKGPIPSHRDYHGLVVMHSCDNPRCCNPAHLSLGRNRDNVADMVAKGRKAFQPKEPASAKLPADVVRLICESEASALALGPEIGVHYKTISQVRRENGIDTQAFRDKWKWRKRPSPHLSGAKL